jgi:hypothetical protein
MKIRIVLAAAAATVALAVAGCGTAATHASPAPSASAPAAPGLAVSDIRGQLATVLADLRQSDAAEQEAWVSGGHGGDLQALIAITSHASGTDRLDTDAMAFNADASDYLSANTDYLAAGWPTEYAQVRADLNALARDCELAPVLAAPGTS